MLTQKKQSSLGIGVVGFVLLATALFIPYDNKVAFLSLSFALMTVGGMLYFRTVYGTALAGIKNDGVWFSALTTPRTLRLDLGPLTHRILYCHLLVS